MRCTHVATWFRILSQWYPPGMDLSVVIPFVRWRFEDPLLLSLTNIYNTEIRREGIEGYLVWEL